VLKVSTAPLIQPAEVALALQALVVVVADWVISPTLGVAGGTVAGVVVGAVVGVVTVTVGSSGAGEVAAKLTVGMRAKRIELTPQIVIFCKIELQKLVRN
jgi:hypothetical protein